MKKISEMTMAELKKRIQLLFFLVITWVVLFIVLCYACMIAVRNGTQLTSTPMFYMMIFIPMVLGYTINGINSIKKEIGLRGGKRNTKKTGQKARPEIKVPESRGMDHLNRTR